MTYAGRAVVSVSRTLTEVLAVAGVDALLECALGVRLALALIGHLVVLVALVGLALELDTLNIALALGHVLALGIGLGLRFPSSGLVVGLRLVLSLLTLTVLQSTTLVLGLAIILGLVLRLLLGLFLRLLNLGVLLDVLGVGRTGTVDVTVRRIGPEVPSARNSDTGSTEDPVGIKKSMGVQLGR